MHGTRDLRIWALTVGVATLAAASPATAIVDLVFSDGFESGSTGAWSATVPPLPLVADPSFEAGPGAGYWNEYSSHFGTTICSLADCGGFGPRTGTWWVWLGGVDNETGYVSQSISLPAGGSAQLTFYLSTPACESTPGVYDTFTVFANGVPIYSTSNLDPFCGQTTYRAVEVDLSVYLGGALELKFQGEFDSSAPSSFYVDDVSITVSP